MTKKLYRNDQYGGTLYKGDCFDAFPEVKTGSVDMVLCDLPYGVTDCAWDTVLPFDKLWAAIERMVRPDGAVVLTGTQPFTSAIVASNFPWFRHEWIYKKKNHSNFMNSKIMPLRFHENVVVFGKKSPRYFPQMVKRKNRIGKAFYYEQPRELIGRTIAAGKFKINEDQYPSSVQEFDNIALGDARGHHPTQKPVSLFEYLIKTYSMEGETVMDMTVGSGTTAIAAINTGRHYICIEQDPAIFKRMEERVKLHWQATARHRRMEAERRKKERVKLK